MAAKSFSHSMPCQFVGELDGRELCCMQNFIGVGIADAAHDARIGERTLECPVFLSEGGAERVEIACKDVDTAGINRMQRLFAIENVQGCAAFGSSFGYDQRTSGKIKGRKIVAARQFCFWTLPMQATGDHQVKNQPEITLYSDCDAFANAPQFAHHSTLDTLERRLRSPKKKDARQPHSQEWLPDDAWLKRTDISRNVR